MPIHLSYGEGWKCDLGYRIDGEVCAPVDVSQNAYENNRSYGTGWECLHGYRQANDQRCDEVIVPVGGYLDASGKRWKCLHGFIRTGDACREIVVPQTRLSAKQTFRLRMGVGPGLRGVRGRMYCKCGAG